MKATGVVRRIDELGRIVIPKEIRKTMHIKEGESIEIFIDGDQSIILKKYSAIKNLSDFAQYFTDSIYDFLKNSIIITDTESVIAVSGPLKKELNGKLLSDNMLSIIQKRESIVEKNKKKIELTNHYSFEGSYMIHPIVNSGDVIGLVIFLSNESQVGEIEKKVVQIASQFFSKYLEE